MTSIRGLPPGRAGRVWLRRRLDVAERGADLLETKLRILAAEEQRFALLVARTDREWSTAVAEADRWMARARLISAQRGLRFAAATAPAQVVVSWDTTMGVGYPARAGLRLPEPAADAATPDSTPLVLAREAYRAALRSGAEHAAAAAALRAVRAEMHGTRRRLRALQRRWVPRLAEARSTLVEALEEQEREEGMRMRWAARRSGGTAAHSARAGGSR